MIVATCQLPETQHDPRAALALLYEHGCDAARTGARVVCFPECFLQGYDLAPAYLEEAAIDTSSTALASLLEELRTLEPVLVVGLLERDGAAFYNTAVAIDRGKVIARYRKMHLLRGEQRVLAPGTAPAVFQVDGVKLGLNICYDLNFEESVRRCTALGAAALLCPCNNLLPLAAAEEWKARHNAIRAAQAKEHGVWIVSSDVVGERDGKISYGPTAVIDPGGTVVAQVPLLTTGMVTANIA